LLLVLIAFFGAGAALASAQDTLSNASLLAKCTSLDERLRENPFQRTLALDSSESPNDVKGDIYAPLDYPFSVVGVALDVVQKIESHLLMRHYEGFMKTGRVRGRRG
jgi:hypothetical protein